MEFIQGTLIALSVFGILCQSAIAETDGVIGNGTVWHDTPDFVDPTQPTGKFNIVKL